jgi:hypothetical protein
LKAGRHPRVDHVVRTDQRGSPDLLVGSDGDLISREPIVSHSAARPRRI